MTKHRYEPAIRRELILKAALIAASRPGGWSKLTRQAIAKEAGCSDALVSHSLGNMPTVRRAIMRAAIKEQIVEIIAQSIAAHDNYAVVRWLALDIQIEYANANSGIIKIRLKSSALKTIKEILNTTTT